MTPAAAARAYTTMANGGVAPQAEKTAAAGDDFASLLQSAMRDVTDTGATADSQALSAATGKTDVVDVVTSVSEAELNVETVVTLRDKVIEAYQEILRMPI